MTRRATGTGAGVGRARGHARAARVLPALIAAAACVLLPGCGYSLAGRGAFLPAYIQTIGVPPFTNNTPVFDVERLVWERVRGELTGRGKYKVLPASAGTDAVLSGEISSIVIAPLALTDQMVASRYVLVMTAKLEFTDVKTGKVLWANPLMQFRDEFEPTTGTNVADANAFFGQDANALDRLATEFARTAVSALLEAF